MNEHKLLKSKTSQATLKTSTVHSVNYFQHEIKIKIKYRQNA